MLAKSFFSLLAYCLLTLVLPAGLSYDKQPNVPVLANITPVTIYGAVLFRVTNWRISLPNLKTVDELSDMEEELNQSLPFINTLVAPAGK